MPPVWGIDTLAPKPLPAVRETSKSFGAVAVILPVKLTPDTGNCCKYGLAEAVPTQPAIRPVTAPGLIVGEIGGVTVMVNVTGVALQPVPPIKKLPVETGCIPTLIVALTVLVAVLITDTLFEF